MKKLLTLLLISCLILVAVYFLNHRPVKVSPAPVTGITETKKEEPKTVTKPTVTTETKDPEMEKKTEEMTQKVDELLDDIIEN